MNYYYVAKTKESGFIGMQTPEEITKQFRTGKLPGTYVVTKGLDSYRQTVKSGTANWVTVADFVANPPEIRVETEMSPQYSASRLEELDPTPIKRPSNFSLDYSSITIVIGALFVFFWRDLLAGKENPLFLVVVLVVAVSAVFLFSKMFRNK